VAATSKINDVAEWTVKHPSTLKCYALIIISIFINLYSKVEHFIIEINEELELNISHFTLVVLTSSVARKIFWEGFKF
jgi:hypothetical protein